MIAVYKRELVGYFKNPVVYTVLALYALVSALFFFDTVILNNTSFMGNYFGYRLFFLEIAVVAVLAMRFFAEERKNRTDQLIMTAPVRLSSVVIGKYLAAMTVYLCCTMINLVYILIVDVYGTPDAGMNFTAMIGTILLGSCMIAIAELVASLTENPLFAAGGTLAVFVLSFLTQFVVAPLRQLLPAWLQWFPKFVERINILSWFDEFAGGIWPLDSTVFYLTMTASFLFLTTRVLERRRWR